MGDSDLHDLTAAFALDALDERDRDAYEEHLARCASCRDELAGLQGAVTALAYAAEGPAPPAALRGRVLAAARAERPNVVPLRPRWAVPAAVAAAVAACAALGFGLWSQSLRNDLSRERATRDALALVAQPEARRIKLAGAEGVVGVTPDGRAALAFARLEPPPKGKAYEAWVVEDGTSRPAGVFRGRTFVLTRTVPAGATIAITLEPEGGSSVPTTRPFAKARV
jgi:anti-sigma-K factor RskA